MDKSSSKNKGKSKQSKQNLGQNEESKESIIPKSICTKNGLVYISVAGKPNAKQSSITDINDNDVGVCIAAPPREGEANIELIDYIRTVLGIKKKDIDLDKGSKSRSKVLIVSGMTEKEVYDALKTEMG